MKIDKRKKYYLLLDVETAGTLDKPLVFDIGLAIADKKGNIYEERSFVIREIFTNHSLMEKAYYYSKFPKYLEGLANGDFTMVNWTEMLTELHQLATKYNVKTVGAYNLAFDKRALSYSHKYLGHKGKILPFPMQQLCLWGLACETIFLQKTYQKVAIKNGWVSKAGNLRTNAEVAYRYISGNYDFIEEHTGLADVRIEAKIMADCFRQNKKISRGIIFNPWRIPNKK